MSSRDVEPDRGSKNSVCLCLSEGLGYYIQDQCIHQTEKGFSIAKLNIMFSATVREKTPAEHTLW